MARQEVTDHRVAGRQAQARMSGRGLLSASSTLRKITQARLRKYRPASVRAMPCAER